MRWDVTYRNLSAPISYMEFQLLVSVLIQCEISAQICANCIKIDCYTKIVTRAAFCVTDLKAITDASSAAVVFDRDLEPNEDDLDRGAVRQLFVSPLPLSGGSLPFHTVFCEHESNGEIESSRAFEALV